MPKRQTLISKKLKPCGVSFSFAFTHFLFVLPFADFVGLWLSLKNLHQNNKESGQFFLLKVSMMQEGRSIFFSFCRNFCGFERLPQFIS